MANFFLIGADSYLNWDLVVLVQPSRKDNGAVDITLSSGVLLTIFSPGAGRIVDFLNRTGAHQAIAQAKKAKKG